MQGECKSPGGKLVKVQLSLQHGLIRDASLSGDFFIIPEANARDTLHRITSTLKGLPQSIDLETLAHRLMTAIPWDVELIGTSAIAIAVAVRRAIGDPHAQIPTLAQANSHTLLNDSEIELATLAWKGLPWRIIPEVALPPALNVALDEVLCHQLASGNHPSTLRFWRWSSQAVILGRCQSVINEVDEQAASSMGITIVRRMTGGGAMFLQPHRAITYSLYLPDHLLAGIPLRQSYQVCDAWAVTTLRRLGVDAFHAPLNDIACSMGKIGGAAQARRQGVILHHTTMAYDMDPSEMARVLRIGKEKLSDKPAVASAAKRVSPLVRQTGLSRDSIVSSLQDSFQERFGGLIDSISPEEMNQARSLVNEKYAHPSWTFDIP